MRCVRCHALFRQLPLILYHLYQMSFVDYTAEWSAVNPFVFDSSICLLKKNYIISQTFSTNCYGFRLGLFNNLQNVRQNGSQWIRLRQRS